MKKDKQTSHTTNQNKRPSRRKLILRLWKYLSFYKWLLLLALIITIASNVFSLVGPLLSGYAIDALEGGISHVNFEVVFHYALLMIIFFVASSIMSYILSLLLIKLSRKVIYKMRKDVFDKLVTLPVDRKSVV